MLAQHCSSVLSTALNSLVAGLTSLKIWSTKSAKKRHLCASISAHSLHKSYLFVKSEPKCYPIIVVWFKVARKNEVKEQVRLGEFLLYEMKIPFWLSSCVHLAKMDFWLSVYSSSTSFFLVLIVLGIVLNRAFKIILEVIFWDGRNNLPM